MDHSDNYDSEVSAIGRPAKEGEATKTIYGTMKDSMRYEFSPKPEIRAAEIDNYLLLIEGIYLMNSL